MISRALAFHILFAILLIPGTLYCSFCPRVRMLQCDYCGAFLKNSCIFHHGWVGRITVTLVHYGAARTVFPMVTISDTDGIGFTVEPASCPAVVTTPRDVIRQTSAHCMFFFWCTPISNYSPLSTLHSPLLTCLPFLQA